MASPKRIMAAFAPKMAISAVDSAMPASIAIRTIISEALTAYSHHRAGLMPRATLRSYQARAGPAVVRWSTAARPRKIATATSMRRSKRLAGPPNSPAPGGPVR